MPSALRSWSVIVVVAVLAVAGCSSSEGSTVDDAAATVNGIEVSDDLLIETTEAAIEAPEGSTTLLSSDTSPILTQLIQLEVARQEVAERDVEITDELRAEAEASLFESLGTDPSTGASDPAAGEQAFNALPKVLRVLSLDAQVTLLALARSIPDDELGIEEVTDDDIEQAYEEALEAAYTRRCANVIVVDPTLRGPDEMEARAQDIVDQLDAGADFDDLVAEETTDPATPSGGPLGCATQSEMEQQQLLPELAAAVWTVGEGEAFGPVVTANGTFVGIVDEDQVVPLDEAEAEIRDALSAQNDGLRSQAMSGLLSTLLLDADVWIAPVHGSWVFLDELGDEVTDADDAASAEVRPPDGPEDAPVTVPDASLPADPFGLPSGS